VAIFFTLAYAFTWALLPLARTSIAASLVALQGPAVAALVVAALGGRADLRDLGARVARWRVPVLWYGVALALPLPITAARSLLESLAGAAGPIAWQPISSLGLVVFVLVAGEEIGWRGFALPRLLARFGPWAASAIVGVLWAVWHLPLFLMPGMPQHGTPFLSYLPYLVSLSLLLTVLALRTKGSVIVATLFHGAVNTFGVVNAGASAGLRGWSNAATYGVAALVIAALAWRRRPAIDARRAGVER
jgi:membrane protease YdiL (CAAX protease family)